MNEKFNLYERSGVREYWVVHPNDKTVQTFLLQEDGKYEENGTLYERTGKVPVHVFNDYCIDMEDIFEN
jgi:Uma2 family endonuclease